MDLPSPGAGSAALLFLFALFFWFSGLGLKEWQKRLGTTGWIPTHIDSAARVCRAAAGISLAFALIALLPPLFDPLIPISIVALVLVGVWSSRDSLRDFAAGWLIQSEGQVAIGVYVQLEAFRGQVTRIGFRTTTLEDASGRRMLVPNRRLVGQHVMVDAARWPMVSVRLHIPSVASTKQIHNLLDHIVRCSPWSAPFPMQVEEGGTPHHWTVKARILELRFEDAFAGALRERVDEFSRKPL